MARPEQLQQIRRQQTVYSITPLCRHDNGEMGSFLVVQWTRFLPGQVTRFLVAGQLPEAAADLVFRFSPLDWSTPGVR